ncbi:MAG: hypothetical protein Q8R02_15945 [Hyphomonadaceae bacterium]|nr:hypothetical protein [Hyphomonadaceae bacterium]
MVDFKANLWRALKQMEKAIKRGDFDAAFGWTMIANRQLRMARRLSDLRNPRHVPKRGR